MNQLRQNMIEALECRNAGLFVPTCELAFFQYYRFVDDPEHPTGEQIAQASGSKREMLVERYCKNIASALERLEHGMLCVWESEQYDMEVVAGLLAASRGRYLVGYPCDATYGIPGSQALEEFCWKLADDPQGMLDQAERQLEAALAKAAQLRQIGCEAIWMCSDYCFNAGPFLSPRMFDTFVTPFLKRQTEELRRMGFYTIKHTDGNIMPILDSLLEGQPHALHSIDAQAGVNIAKVREITFPQKVALIGNVEHQFLEIGAEDDLRRSCEYCLTHGGAGKPGYIYSTSNAINNNSRIERYLLMQQIRHEFMERIVAS